MYSVEEIICQLLLRHSCVIIPSFCGFVAQSVSASIDKENGTPSTAISNRMGMEPSSITRTLKSMEERGLIYREKNPEDGRGVLIYLTEFGKEKRELSKTTVLKFNEVVKNNLTEEQLATFFKVTETINNLITERKIFDIL